MAYFGAACAVAFAARGVYRARLSALLSQAAGAALGLLVGTLVPDDPVLLVAVAAGAGAISGVVGVIGPNAPAFGMMLTIEVAFGEFEGLAAAVGGAGSVVSRGDLDCCLCCPVTVDLSPRS